MTWVYKHTLSPGARIAAEYECCVHGRFQRDVYRDKNGDPPGMVPCGIPNCARASEHVISAPACTRVQRVTAARRGKDPERPPNCLDWQALAYEEKSPEEWEAAERKKDWEATRKIVKEALR